MVLHSAGRTVSTKPLGLYYMHGNVWVGRGLLSQELRRRAGRWLGLDEGRRVQSAVPAATASGPAINHVRHNTVKYLQLNSP